MAGNCLAVRIRILLSILLIAGFIGSCSSGNREAGFIFDSDTGSHPTGWLSTHSFTAVSDISMCSDCHSDNLSGGISGVSCMTSDCHHDPIPNWALPAVHGGSAKRAPGSSGFTSCQVCHGKDLSGGLSGLDCFSCHGSGALPDAPHPNNWLPGDPQTHIDTDTANADVCALCHAGEPDSGFHDPVEPLPGSDPGCFNNTLCHGAVAAHPVGNEWTDPNPNFHGIEAKKDLRECQTCHGTPGTTLFDGGIAPTSCDTCHPQAKAHTIRWFEAPETGFPPYTASHRNSGNRTVACAICHRVDGPGTGPEPGAPSCFSDSFNGAGCHANGPGEPNHSIPFLEHPQQALASFDTNCSNCHAESGTSSVSGAPTCDTCHQSGSPLTFTNCTSCHADPPDDPSGPYPNTEGGHTVHVGLDRAGTPVACDTCHSGLESGSQNHYDRANARAGGQRGEPGDVAFNNLFNALAGAANFDSALAALSCDNVRCHGGIATPNWRTGSIDTAVDTGDSTDGCRACHTPGGSEPNSPVSGKHSKHLFDLGSGGNALCTECHDMQNGTTGANNHFAFLSTDTLEGPAGDTVEPEGNPGAYNAADKTCTVTCHGVQHTDFSWEGESLNHAVPFLGTRHTQDSRSTFSSDCAACHELTPANPDSFPPTCATCHQAGSPIALTDCTSCHADPPDDPAGPYPNFEGGHPVHAGLDSTGTPVACDTCHSGFESGSQNHYDRANARSGGQRGEPGDVAFNNTYNASAGAATFNSSLAALTCGNVRCHGGVATPNWRTGSIDTTVDTGDSTDGCRRCHALGSGEPSEPASGKHDRHLTGLGSKGNALCTECHDMQNGTNGANNHFALLTTDTLEGPAGDTVEPNDSPTAYDAAEKSCTVFCHTQLHSSWKWEAPDAPHPFGDGWNIPNASFHGLTAKQDLAFCQSCHGTPGNTSFDGGTAGTPCSTCHPQAGAHPIRWFEAPETGFPPYTASHRNSGNIDVACAICHRVDGPGTGPDPGAPSCFSDSFNGASCHSSGPGSANHSVPNLDATHTGATQTDFDNNCSDCHATTGVSPVPTAPACDTCHTNFAARSPLTNKDCTSCHAEPPGGTAYPNIAGRHGPHDALPGVTGNCATCHTGLESGTLAHYNRAKGQEPPGDVDIPATYDSNSHGLAAFSSASLTCSGVSCHGGQTTPDWQTGGIDVDTGCEQCHESGTGEANSFNSGRHRKHVEEKFPSEFPGIVPTCIGCHDTGRLAVGHFDDLATPGFEQDPFDTIRLEDLQYDGVSCNPDNGGVFSGCHGNKRWN